MLSVIVCSVDKEAYSALSENIALTIGDIQYEMIRINNETNNYNITTAYNMGIDRATFSNLLFVHEDVIFHTARWGEILLKIFADENIGLMGIAGTKIKTKMPSAWWDCPEAFKAINIIQHKDQAKKRRFTGFNEEKETDVVAIDGVFMAMKKNDFIRFNTKIKGYHNYDLNISFEHFQKEKRIVVTKQILLEHLSPGKLDESWIRSSIKLHELYNCGPHLVGEVNSSLFKKLEIDNGVKCIHHLLRFGLRRKAFYWWGQILKLRPSTKTHWRILKMFVAR
ncbi:Glycosyltransferase like family protein [Salinimicrobium catena]|uniref:Glycosyltransferase like family protein n=1 Tax=Salinimicrobium catena TaxID=390640 RepID=A0A1H5NDA6_9FLAO|nr:glycosyltransferase [Salinimicrobium catena]SDL41352.1 Glycosyltransferase like family protein [Salinimicrobium catena]SEE98648.1 Glycosyltransferase like family protein [Salinimicrobium catena]